MLRWMDLGVEEGSGVQKKRRWNPSTLDGKRKIIKQELNSLSQKKSNPAVPWF